MTEELQKLLCTLEIVKTNVKGRHWTLKGEKFRSWHLQFDQIYDVLKEASDTVGELIVQAGDVPFHAPSQFLRHSMCEEQLSVNWVRSSDSSTTPCGPVFMIPP